MATFDRNGEQEINTPLLSYDVAEPGFGLAEGHVEPFLYSDLPATNIPVQFDAEEFNRNRITWRLADAHAQRRSPPLGRRPVYNASNTVKVSIHCARFIHLMRALCFRRYRPIIGGATIRKKFSDSCKLGEFFR